MELAISHMERVYQASPDILLRAPYAIPGTDVGYAATIRFTMPGTDLLFAATARLRTVLPAKSLRPTALVSFKSLSHS
eukprot:2938400-Rhodomonas_salina.1